MKPCTVTERIRFRRAEVGAWRALAPFHYLGGAPRGVSVIFSADYIPARSYKRTGHRWRRLLAESQTAAVLVVSRPVPDVRARNLATHGRYCSQRSRHLGLTLLNREVRTISRVVVHPQFRGLGLAHRLVSHALPRVGTAYVEAIAVMGEINPFFERAGMVRYQVAPSQETTRLRAALESVGITGQQCTDLSSLTSSIAQLSTHPKAFVGDEMERWYRRRYHRRWSTADSEIIAKRVTQHLRGQPLYFLWHNNTLDDLEACETPIDVSMEVNVPHSHLKRFDNREV